MQKQNSSLEITRIILDGQALASFQNTARKLVQNHMLAKERTRLASQANKSKKKGKEEKKIRK